MAANWLKKYLVMKPEVSSIFDDLNSYRSFCVEYGYTFDERHLYNEKSPYGEYVRALRGRDVRDNWGNPSGNPYSRVPTDLQT